MLANACASRLKDRENERRCKANESNKAVSTAIRLCEEESESRGLDSTTTSASGSGSTTSASSLLATQDPMALFVENRLGYSNAKVFADKLDIMQKIIKAYRYPDNTPEERDFLLGLICGSFTRDEANKIVMPPETQVLAPGRVRNTAQISGHKWTFIRKTAGPNMHASHKKEKEKEKERRKEQGAAQEQEHEQEQEQEQEGDKKRKRSAVDKDHQRADSGSGSSSGAIAILASHSHFETGSESHGNIGSSSDSHDLLNAVSQSAGI